MPMHQTPDLGNARRLLIAKLSSIGDVVHALPVAAALHERYPHLEIDWIAEPPAASVLIGSPVLSQVHVAARRSRAHRLRHGAVREYVALVRRLRNRSYDLALDLQGLTKSAVVVRLSGAKVRLGYDWLREATPFLETRVPRSPASVHPSLSRIAPLDSRHALRYGYIRDSF